jgi:hypothetical protein
VVVRTLNSRVQTVIRKSQDLATADKAPVHIFEAVFDLSKVPLHETVALPIEFVSRAPTTGALNSATFYVDDETGLLSCWLLLPEGKQYQNFDLLRYQSGKEEGPERVTPAYQFDTLEGRVLAFALLNVEPGFTYEAHWEHRE